MRKVLATAAFAAGLIATSAFAAEAVHNPGGPMAAGKMCWSATDGLDHGFWKTCPKPAKMSAAVRKASKMKSAS